MKRLYGSLAAISLLSASAAWAVKDGDNLYVKAKTKALKEAKATAGSVKDLNVGDVVVWKGPSATDKLFHKVLIGTKEAYVTVSALSPNKPQLEVAESGKPGMDTKAFASSGAATKGLTEASLKYAKEKGPTMERAAVEVIYAEEHSKNKGTPEAIAVKAKELGGAK
jgi:hypothetical protein